MQMQHAHMGLGEKIGNAVDRVATRVVKVAASVVVAAGALVAFGFFAPQAFAWAAVTTFSAAVLGGGAWLGSKWADHSEKEASEPGHVL